MKILILVLTAVLLASSAMAAETMLSKARSLTLPTLQYRDVPLKDILADIQVKSRSIDPEGTGVNFLVKLDDSMANRKLTMTVNTPTIERALKLLAATAALYIQYNPDVIVIQASERVTGEQ